MSQLLLNDHTLINVFDKLKTYEDLQLVGLMYNKEVHSALRFCKSPVLNGILEDSKLSRSPFILQPV